MVVFSCGCCGGGLDDIGGHIDVHGVVITVGVAGDGRQGNILLVDLDFITVLNILGILRNLPALRLGGGDLLQGVHAVAAHAVGAPSVHLGTAGGQIALFHVNSNGLHLAIEEDDVGVSILGGQITGVAVHAGDEHVLVGLLILLDADQVAVLVEDHVVGGVLEVGVAVLF